MQQLYWIVSWYVFKVHKKITFLNVCSDKSNIYSKQICTECTDATPLLFRIFLCIKKQHKPHPQLTFKENIFSRFSSCNWDFNFLSYRNSHFLFTQLNCKVWFLCQISCFWINVRISFGTSTAQCTKVYSIITCSQGLHIVAVSNTWCFNPLFLNAYKTNIEQSHSLLISINPDMLKQTNLLSYYWNARW